MLEDSSTQESNIPDTQIAQPNDPETVTGVVPVSESVSEPVKAVEETTPEVSSETPKARSILSMDEDKTEVPKADWYHDEDTPGVGEKPEWLSDKYNNVAEQAKAQGELRKLLSGFTGAPEEYKLNIDPMLEMTPDQIDLEDPLMMGFKEWAKESNLSQDGFDKIVNMKLLQEYRMGEEFAKTMEEFTQNEMAKLSDEEYEQQGVMAQWGKNNLPQELWDEFAETGKTANGHRMLLALKNNSIGSKIPTDIPNKSSYERHELIEMIDDPRYDSDVQFQDRVKKAYMDNA